MHLWEAGGGSPLEPPALLGTGFQLSNTVLYFLLPELYKTKYVLFKATKSVAIHYSSHRNLIEILVIGCGLLL